MKRAAMLVPLVALLAGLAWPAARGVDAGAGVCALMTPARLLEHPGIAEAYAEALRSGDAGEVDRVAGLLRGIRSAHGCEGDFALPASPRATPVLPPGHPPVGAPSLDGERGMPHAPLFEGPGVVTI